MSRKPQLRRGSLGKPSGRNRPLSRWKLGSMVRISGLYITYLQMGYIEVINFREGINFSPKKKTTAWKAKCPIFKAIVAGFRGKVT